MSNPIRQHLIDPETCIRCNTCETRCPTKAIRHERNYVVDPEKCNFCMKCVRPCPTGAVDHYFDLARRYSIGDQLRWIELPPELQRVAAEYEHAATEFGHSVRGDQIAPVSASNPPLIKYTQDNPARAIVSCNTRVTGENAENDVRHIVLEFDETQFVFKGQSVSIISARHAALFGCVPSRRRKAERWQHVARNQESFEEKGRAEWSNDVDSVART